MLSMESLLFIQEMVKQVTLSGGDPALLDTATQIAKLRKEVIETIGSLKENQKSLEKDSEELKLKDAKR